MKHILSIVVALIVAISAMAQDGARIRFSVDNYANSPIVLGYYYNDQMLVKDTVFTDAKGDALYTTKDHLEEGVYIVYFPDNQFIDITMGKDQQFEIKCDTLPKAINRFVVTNCDELADFVGYQVYLGEMQAKYKEASDEFKAAEGNKAKQDELKAEFELMDELVKQKNVELIEKYKGECLALFLNGLRDIEVPEPDLTGVAEEKKDSVRQSKRYYYYRAHYFDNIPLNDPRSLRTPYFVKKLDKYITETVPQIPDTVAAECLRLIKMAEGNDETFRYVVSHLYNAMNSSKTMGMDAALVAIADEYYLKGKCTWSEQKFIDDLREQVGKIRYTLIGRQAVDLKMIDPNGQWFQLSEVDAPFTILVFWEPSCGHCKKEVPQLKTQVWDKYASKGVKIFAVYCQTEPEEWKKFIAEHQLEEWMNVYDPYRRTNFRNYYNINSTPQIFILDENKKIIAKKIGVDQIGGFLDFMFEQKSKK